MMGVFVEVDSPGWKHLRGYVIQENGCWEWIGLKQPSDSYLRPDNGYGRWRGRAAHRVMYEMLVGPIPEGMELDHLCRFKACVNPAHLQPVTHAENVRRTPRELFAAWHHRRKAEGWVPYAVFGRAWREAEKAKAKQRGRI